jgi:hypothetical protein
MNDTPDTTNACLEGADIPREPIRVVMYGDHFASIDGELMMSASGPNAADDCKAIVGHGV